MSATTKFSTITQILTQAIWCPSPDNLQPWRFKLIDENNFEIHCKDESDWMVYDINGHVTWLTIGFLFECINISAAKYNLSTNYQKLTNDTPQLTIFNVELTPQIEQADDALFEWLPIRSVQRKPMGSRTLTDTEKNTLQSLIPDGFELHWYESLSDRFKIGKLLYGNSFTRYAMKEGYEVHSKVIDWRKGYEQFSPTKIPPKSLGVDPVTLTMTKWALGKWERFHIVEKYFAGTVWARFIMDFYTSIRCSGHFLLTRKKTAETLEDFIESGQVIMRFWLTCQKLGLGFQPEHTPVMFAELMRNNTPFSKDDRANNNAKKMDDIFKSLIGEDKVNRSVYLARVGRAPLPVSRSIRKELSDLIIE